MPTAHSYQAWLQLAEEFDRRTGGDLWRRNDESRLYDHVNIALRLQRLRRKGDENCLLFVLNEDIHGNMEGIGKPQLYGQAKCGTKLLIEDYINEFFEALDHLSPRQMESIPWADRIEFFQHASR
jgi:NTE family protein